MSISEIILSVILLLISVGIIVFTLSMDKTDGNNLAVINGIHENMRKNAKSDAKSVANKGVTVMAAILLIICIVMTFLSELGVGA